MRKGGPGARVLGRLTREVTAALRRRPSGEERLAGALRAVGARWGEGRALLADAAATLVKRGATARPLLAGALGALIEAEDERGSEALAGALGAEEGLGLLGLAARCGSGALEGPLLRAASSRSPQVAFAAETARLLRGESGGGALEALALRLKEASRIELCTELFWPLLQGGKAPAGLAPALAVLRGAERHLGRWLLLAELAVAAGDRGPVAHARGLAEQGPASARSSWALVGWVLAGEGEPPALRLSLDALVRLSDRPTTERNLSFLFRMAGERALPLRSHLEGLAAGLGQATEGAIRAAFFLARDHDREDLRAGLRGVLRSRREGGWGLAAAALHDLGDPGAEELAERCLEARSLTAVAWGGLVLASLAEGPRPPLLTEACVRHLHLGLLA